jgi:hypothetical protein
MLSPRAGKVLLAQQRKEQEVATSNGHSLETKFGWGHAQFKKDLADDIEALKIDPSWRPDEVLRHVARLVRNS